MRRDKLVALRKSNGLTQAQVGKMLGLGREAVALYEGGQRLPSIETALRLSRLYGVTMEAICDALDVTADNILVGRRTSQ